MGITLELFVLPDILVPEDAAATVNNLAASEALFRAAVAGYLTDLVETVINGLDIRSIKVHEQHL